MWAVQRDFAYQRPQVLAAPLVADPAGDADVEAEVDVRVKLVDATGEAMGDGLFHSMVPENLRKPRMRVPRMQEKRLADVEGELELREEPFLLVRMRRVIAVEVEAALADRNTVGVLRDLLELGDRALAALACMVRMNPGRKRKAERASLPAFFDRGAGDDDGLDAGRTRPRHDRVPVLAER